MTVNGLYNHTSYSGVRATLSISSIRFMCLVLDMITFQFIYVQPKNDTEPESNIYLVGRLIGSPFHQLVAPSQARSS